MKAKKLLLTLSALIIVACVAVGGTLAYLTAQDTKVTNTFTFANGITVNLKETNPNTQGGINSVMLKQATASGDEDTGYAYTNVVPGQTLPKQPKVIANNTIDTYVFIKVEGLTDILSLKNAATDITDNGWEAIGTVDQYGNGVYGMYVSAGNTDEHIIFSAVVVGDVVLNGSSEVSYNVGTINIGVSAIQASGFADAAAAYDEAPAFLGLN